MDVRRIEPPVAVVQRKPSPVRVRPPLVTSEKGNVVQANGKVRQREVASRYKSAVAAAPVVASATPRRSPSPNVSRTSPALAPVVSQKRAQSAERKRPASAPSTRPSTPSSPPARPSSPSSRLPASSASSRPSTPASSRPSTPASPPSRPTTPVRESVVDTRKSSPSSRLPASSASSRPSTPASPPSRPTTPVRESVVDTRNSSRVALGGRDGLWPSMRSLSSSYQSESSSLLTSKKDRMVRNPSPDATSKPSANAVPERRRSPLRGRNISDHSENSRPNENSHSRMIDQHRWPGMGKMSTIALTRSVDLTDKVNRSRSASFSVANRGVSPTRRLPLFDTMGISLHRSVNEAPRRLASEGNKVLERETSSGANVTSQISERAPSTTRPSRTLSSPVPGLHRPSSPSRTLPVSSSTTRGMQSPSRTRPSTPVSPSRTRPSTPVSPSRTRPSTPVSPTSSTASRMGNSSIFNYSTDVRTGKKNANHMEDVHQLRLLHNRDLQWRFVNAQADAALSSQKTTAENSLANTWSMISELHDSVMVKRISLQKLKQEMMLDQILKEQIAYLEEWTSMEKEHSSCVSGAFEALNASTLRLPVTGGARADIRAVKNAVSSAVDVMQAMGSSICYLLSRVEGTNLLASELCEVAARERAMLDECRELLASITAMQVQDCSLQAHLMQLRQDVA